MDIFDYFANEEPGTGENYLFIHNVGFSHNRPGYSAGVVDRPYYLLHYIVSGGGTYDVNGKTYHLSEHDGFLVPSDTPVIYTADKSDPWTCYWVGFSGPAAPNLVKQMSFRDDVVFHYDKDSYIADVMERMYRNIMDAYCPQETLSGFLLLIAGRLIHAAHEDREIIQFSPLHQAVSFIQRSVYSSITLQDVVNYVGLSSSQLYRIFMKELGIAPYQFILKTKMEKACELIRDTKMNYVDISHVLGFEYESHFFKLFRSFTGTTPSTYRKCRQDMEKDTT